jgi:purine-binding chemotaxis protein CheW
VESSRQLCTFYVAGLFCGVDANRVQEIIRYQDITSVPLAPAVVQGLINLRGQILIAIDLRRRLGLAERPADQVPMNVVVHTNDGTVSLLVDDIGDVFKVSEERFELPPETISEVAKEMVHGVYKLDEKLLLRLNIDKAADVAATVGQGVERL